MALEDLHWFKHRGVDVVVTKADASKASDVRRVLEWVHEELPYIQHYAHAAGVSGFDMLQDTTTDAFWDVANTKVVGASSAATWLPPTESQLLFSSTSAIWSQTGAAHYAGANAFLDGHATQQQYAGLPCTSLQLGPFAEAGMAAGHVEELRAIGLKPLQPRQIVEAAAVAGTVPLLAFARIQAPRFVQLYTAKGRWSLVDDMLKISSQQHKETIGSTAAKSQGEVHPASQVSTTSNKAADNNTSVEAVAAVIRRTAADIIGEAMDGK